MDNEINFDNPMYGSVINSNIMEFEETQCVDTFANYEAISTSDVDSEGYLKVSKRRLSFTESECDDIYDEIKN